MSARATDAINAQTVDFLLSPTGRAAADALSAQGVDDEQLLARLDELRRRYTPAQAGALVALARLRQQAARKFPAAHQLFFTAEALEQATAAPIAAHRAAWIDQHAPPGPLLDLGSGIGGDLLALAQHRPVIAYETDPVRLQLAQANAAALGLADRVSLRQADWTDELARGTLPPAAAAFADPARRSHGKRIFHLDAMQPPLARLRQLQTVIPALGVKVMPGVDDAEIPPDCAVEFISHTGVCKEAVLWFGPLVPLAGQPRRWASVHTGPPLALDAWLTLIATGIAPPIGPLAPGMTLHEPDPAVIRAGAFAELCDLLTAHLFDAQIAYLVSDLPHTSPFVQSFRILEIHPFALKALQSRLQALGMSRVELKKRGAPFAPESLRGRLTLPSGNRPGVVIFTRRGDERLMLIAERL